MILKFALVLLCVSGQYVGNTIIANLTATDSSPTHLNLTFSAPLNSTPAFQIFTTSQTVQYQIVSNTNNQIFIIKSITPKDLLATTVTLMFNQPLDLNLSISSFILQLQVIVGVASSIYWPVLVATIAFIMCLYGNAGIMMVQFLQVYTKLRALNLFYHGFITNLNKYIFFKWSNNLIFSSLPQNAFLNSCLFVMIVYVLSITISLIIYKLVRDPTNPILKWIKKLFNFSFMTVVYKITSIPIGVGIIQNFIMATSKPSVTATLIVNHILCIIFAILYLLTFVSVIWFMHYSGIKDYYQPSIYAAYRKVYMQIQTDKGYKRFYVVYLYIKALVMAICCVLQFGIMIAVVIEDFQIFMIMITRPYKTVRYHNMMLFSISSQFISYLFQSTSFMFKHLGVTLMQNHATFVIGTTSLVFFIVALFHLAVISGYQAYIKLRSFVDNFKWERRQSDRMIQMNRLTSKRESYTKRESLLRESPLMTARSRHQTKTSQLF